jgi:hypothetical protein
MWKNALAYAIIGLLAGGAITLHPSAADASRSGCREAAKVKFPADAKARAAYKRYCRGQWKAYKAAHHVR